MRFPVFYYIVKLIFPGSLYRSALFCKLVAKALTRMHRVLSAYVKMPFSHRIRFFFYWRYVQWHSFIRTSRCISDILSHFMTKPTKWHVRPAKTQKSLGIRQSDQSSLSARRNLVSLNTHRAHSAESDRTWQMSRLI